jgi:hypothetical protein
VNSHEGETLIIIHALKNIFFYLDFFCSTRNGQESGKGRKRDEKEAGERDRRRIGRPGERSEQ